MGVKSKKIEDEKPSKADIGVGTELTEEIFDAILSEYWVEEAQILHSEVLRT